MAIDFFIIMIQFVNTASNMFPLQGTSYQISNYNDNLENTNTQIENSLIDIEITGLIQNTQESKLDYLFMCTFPIFYPEISDFFIQCYICYTNSHYMNCVENRQTFKQMRNCLKEIISSSKELLTKDFRLSKSLKVLQYHVSRFNIFWQHISLRISRLLIYFNHFSKVNQNIRNFLNFRSHIIDQYLERYSLYISNLRVLDVNEFPLENIKQKMEWFSDNVFVAKLSLNNQITAIRLEIELVEATQHLLLLQIQRCRNLNNINESAYVSSLLEEMSQNVLNKRDDEKITEKQKSFDLIENDSDRELEKTQKIFLKIRNKYML